MSAQEEDISSSSSSSVKQQQQQQQQQRSPSVEVYITVSVVVAVAVATVVLFLSAIRQVPTEVLRLRLRLRPAGADNNPAVGRLRGGRDTLGPKQRRRCRKKYGFLSRRVLRASLPGTAPQVPAASTIDRTGACVGMGGRKNKITRPASPDGGRGCRH